MKNQRFWIGVVLGAVVGGVSTLFDKETRAQTKQQFQQAKGCARYIAQNPADVIEQAKNTSNQLNEKISENAEGAINAIGQAEETLNKLRKKED